MSAPEGVPDVAAIRARVEEARLGKTEESRLLALAQVLRYDIPALLDALDRERQRGDLLRDTVTRACNQRDEAEARADAYRGLLVDAEDRLAEDGCDCGSPGDIPCVLCRVRAALAPKGQEDGK